MLIDQFIEMISKLGIEYFTSIELDYLEEIQLIDIGILALLLTLPSFNPSKQQHQNEFVHHHHDYAYQFDRRISNS